ncbi:MAG: hypothetical protein E7305_05625 [Butyrivibrio sp.]|nr:hypothetical protein [Butyrivibrio sp.]
MRESFFRDLKFVESAMLGKIVNIENDYSAETKAVVRELIRFVEGASYAPGGKNGASAFICKHWRLSVKELSEEWAKLGKSKSLSAFRAQISNLSKILYSYFSKDAMAAIIVRDDASEIKRVLMALRYERLSFAELFPEVNALAEYPDKNYEIEEIRDELSLLVTITRIRNAYKKMDPNKLGYIKQILDGRLIDNRNKSLILKAIRLI